MKRWNFAMKMLGAQYNTYQQYNACLEARLFRKQNDGTQSIRRLLRSMQPYILLWKWSLQSREFQALIF